MKLTTEQEKWLNEQAAKSGIKLRFALKTKSNLVNPMLALGPGPTGMVCKQCRHLERWDYSKTYFKCGLRLNTHGPATDHRANWAACAKFEPLENRA